MQIFITYSGAGELAQISEAMTALGYADKTAAAAGIPQNPVPAVCVDTDEKKFYSLVASQAAAMSQAGRKFYSFAELPQVTECLKG